jgi:hypothetical protein
MKEIFDFINFLNIYYNNFVFSISDDIREKFNKTIMFCLYLIIILWVIGRTQYYIFPFAIIIVILFVRNFYSKELFIKEDKCRPPTVDNPFMNVLYDHDGKEACDADEEEVLEKHYDGVFRNPNDLFDKRIGQLYFRTNNVTTLPNKYKEFLNYVGSTYDQPGNNCKYTGTNCLEYQDIRIR